ncbi:MAG: motility associated factor glycosyltransferase family protein [Spirochaetes bacterium]|nr:motility associated factor glycosyltransferase family protein [Spirochaetota bacterium]
MIIQKNFQFLSDEVIKTLNKIKSEPLEYKLSKDKLFIPVYNNVTLHSIYNPFKEGKIFKADKKDLLIAIGLAAGYHLYELAKNGHQILVIPVNYNILKEVLSKIDLSDFFKQMNFKIIAIDELINYFDFFNYTSYSIVIHPAFERIFSSQILTIIKEVKSILNQTLLEINTYKKFGKLWFKNCIKNLVSLFDNEYNFDPIIIENKPILITGAGPSLYENIEYINKIKNRVYIAVADTGLKVLNTFCIKPDFVFSFDVQNYSYLHFIGTDRNIRIFTDLTTSLKLIKNQTFLFSNYPLLKLIKKYWNQADLYSDARNIGGAMISFFSNYFNKYPIITAGIDYGIKNSYLYSRYTYNDEYKIINGNYLKTIDLIDCELLYKDIFIENISQWKTTFLLKSYRESLDVNQNIFTLSDSPFCPFIKIKAIDEIIEKSKKMSQMILEFSKPTLKKNDFLSYIIKEIRNNSEILYSYFISDNKLPDDKVIDDICLYINKFI